MVTVQKGLRHRNAVPEHAKRRTERTMRGARNDLIALILVAAARCADALEELNGLPPIGETL